MPNCIVCNTPNVKLQHGSDLTRYDCERCGTCVLSETAVAVLSPRLEEMPLRRSLMSHTLRRMQRPGETHHHIISSDEPPSFWEGIVYPIHWNSQTR